MLPFTGIVKFGHTLFCFFRKTILPIFVHLQIQISLRFAEEMVGATTEYRATLIQPVYICQRLL